MSVYIICEIGSNHDGDIKKARHMVKAAQWAGANGVKFQIFKANTLYSSETKDFDKYADVCNLIKTLEQPLSFFSECAKICSEYNVEFLATPFDDEAVDFLVDLGVRRMKVASFEFSDIRLINKIASTGLPIIASTGLSSDIDIERFLGATKNNDVTLLHCNSSYPTPDEDAHLAAITYLKKFGTKVGYSDHTNGLLAPSLAVALGATVIEKHFTLDRTSPGPDHSFAIEPSGFMLMVQSIRQCEAMLGKVDLQRSQSEMSMMYARRSVVAACFMHKGHTIKESDITTKRPGSGIPASDFFEIVGCKTTCDVTEDQILNQEHVERMI